MHSVNFAHFLLARIDEDGAAARAASPGGWHFGDVESVAGGMLYDKTRSIAEVVYEQPKDHDGTIVRHLLSTEADANGAHIARHDPMRVLAECEGKRRIVELHGSYRVTTKNDGLNWNYNGCEACEEPEGWEPKDGGWWPCETLRLIALPYADHPDYREEWKP